MKQSEQINELAKALAKARASFKPVVKDQVNPFFKSKYASFESCVAATEPSLTANGLLIFQAPDYVDGKMVLATRLMHTSGQWLQSDAPLLPAKQDSQSLGASITYMKRYSWVVMAGLPGTDIDDDGESERVAKAPAVATLSKEQMGELERIFAKYPGYRENVTKALQGKPLTQLPLDMFSKIRANAKADHQKEQQQKPEFQELGF